MRTSRGPAAAGNPAHDDWLLLDAVERVISRLIGEPRVNFDMLAELEELRDELERELLAGPTPAPPGFAPKE